MYQGIDGQEPSVDLFSDWTEYAEYMNNYLKSLGKRQAAAPIYDELGRITVEPGGQHSIDTNNVVANAISQEAVYYSDIPVNITPSAEEEVASLTFTTSGGFALFCGQSLGGVFGSVMTISWYVDGVLESAHAGGTSAISHWTEIPLTEGTYTISLRITNGMGYSVAFSSNFILGLELKR